MKNFHERTADMKLLHIMSSDITLFHDMLFPCMKSGMPGNAAKRGEHV